ncbi:hypothetical protein CK203_116170 [Vitis vinifera]|uniref:Uncharacterized protein n=1 Tax=Vitis vinifera TaxID=29760 RepID=A0A438E2Y9_VITVI|nr:hypothetical protein CK203_116170 [Vitis vinifera]
MCGGDFMSKNPEEAIDFLSYVAEVSRGWDEPNARKMGRMKSQPNAKGGMYVLNEDIDMKAKIAAMTRRLEELEMKKVQKVQAISETPVQAMPCSICQSYEHLVEECPTIPIVREMFGGVSYKQMRNHPNFSWKPKPPQYTQPARAPQQALNLEQAIANLSKGIHEVEAQEGESSNVREVKAVITLRSGKEVDQPTSKPKHDEESVGEKEKKDSDQGRYDEETHASTFLPSFAWKKGTNNASEIFEVLRQVNVNIPLLDMIKQVPTYAKLLKDLWIVKRGLNVNKKAFLTKQVNAIHIVQVSSEVQRSGLSYHLNEYWRDLCGENFVGLGSKCEFATLLYLQAAGTWRVEANIHHSISGR